MLRCNYAHNILSFQAFYLNFYEKPSDLFDEPIFLSVSYIIIVINFVVVSLNKNLQLSCLCLFKGIWLQVTAERLCYWRIQGRFTFISYFSSSLVNHCLHLVVSSQFQDIFILIFFTGHRHVFFLDLSFSAHMCLLFQALLIIVLVLCFLFQLDVGMVYNEHRKYHILIMWC